VLLAVDTSTRQIGLALFDGSQVIAETVWQSQNHHTVELAPALSALLANADVKPAALTGLGVALGPGSFTSLRIGLGLVKGMALALKIPLVGVPTLDFLANAQPPAGMPLAAVLQAGRGRLALTWYHFEDGVWLADGDPAVVTAEELAQSIRKPTLVCGELSAEERQLLARKRKNVLLASPAQSVRRPAFLAEIAWARIQAGVSDDPVSLAPIYLHVAEVIPS
jgi:tRNA threonylcarbamoyladenosine biosynthesis protein TsaB